jgi:Protein of unknown function (DUF2752)
MNLKNKKIEYTWLFLLGITPLVLWFLPATFFDDSKVILCPSRLFFDFECWGCGITRAVMHLHHLDFEDALYFNQLVVVVYPALVVTWFLWVTKSYKRLKKNPSLN